MKVKHECPLCPKRYQSGRDLKRHLKKIHGITPGADGKPGPGEEWTDQKGSRKEEVDPGRGFDISRFAVGSEEKKEGRTATGETCWNCKHAQPNPGHHGKTELFCPKGHGWRSGVSPTCEDDYERAEERQGDARG